MGIADYKTLSKLIYRATKSKTESEALGW